MIYRMKSLMLLAIYYVVQIASNFDSDLEKVHHEILAFEDDSSRNNSNEALTEECCPPNCNKNNSLCKPCAAGYHGKTCKHQCLPLYYGEECKSKCRCSIFQDCHNVLGCVCKTGYTGDNCLEVEEPPLITSFFENSYYMQEWGDTPKTFQCSSSGNPVPTFQWTYDGKVLYDSQQVSSNRYTGQLTITKPSIRDFGTYQCSATNKYGTAVSAAFKIERAVILSFSDTVERTLPYARQYRNLSIPCTGKPRCKPDSECRVEWKLGEGTSNTIHETKRIAIDKYGTLHFLYVELTDGSTATMPYACGVNNELMRAFYKGGNVIVTVLKVYNPSSVRPLVIFSQDVKGLLGKDAELQCIFSGYPLPDIEWYSPNNSIIRPSSRYQFTDGRVKRNLRIHRLSIGDEGTYTCAGTNILGRALGSLYVNVTSKPIFRDGETLKSQVISDGQNAVFECKMESLPFEEPPSVPIWRQNGNELYHGQYDSNLSHKYQLSSNKETLTIMNVKYPEDTSSIMCETGNVIIDINGEDSYVRSYAYAFLRVLACPSGFILTKGNSCEPCTENWYGNDCLYICKCNTLQRCDNVFGCVNTQTYSRSTTTQSTNLNTRVFDLNIVVYILVIACGVILVLGISVCKNKWKKGNSRRVQTINEDENLNERHLQDTAYNGIYDEIEELEMVENFDINPIQMENKSNEETENSDDTCYLCPLNLEDENNTTEDNNYLYPLYSEDSNDITDATRVAVHESCCSIHISDQRNYVFASEEDTLDSKGEEKIQNLTHEQRKDTDDSPGRIEHGTMGNEYLDQYHPLHENWKQASHTYTKMQPLHPLTEKLKSSSDKIEENSDQENSINKNMKYIIADERLHANHDNSPHTYLQLLSVEDTSDNKDETIC